MNLSKLRPFLDNGKSYYLDDSGTVLPSDIQAVFTRQDWEAIDKEVNRLDPPYTPVSPITLSIHKSCKLDLTGVKVADIKLVQEENLPSIGDEPKFIVNSVPIPITYVDIDNKLPGDIAKMIVKQDYVYIHAAMRRVMERVELETTRTLSATPGITVIEDDALAEAALAKLGYYGPHKVYDYACDDYLFTSVLQLTPDVIRIVCGLKPTFFHWPETNGFRLATIMVPQLRKDYRGEYGTVLVRHGKRRKV
jgi:hypothetical protein